MERLRHRIDVVEGIRTNHNAVHKNDTKASHSGEVLFVDWCAWPIQTRLTCNWEREREWITHTWWHWIIGTIFGICVVDAYLAYGGKAS